MEEVAIAVPLFSMLPNVICLSGFCCIMKRLLASRRSKIAQIKQSK